MSLLDTMIEIRSNPDLLLCGRRKIYTAVEDITKDNVVDVLNFLITAHISNLQQEEYLYWYRRGIQPILARTKQIRPDICNKIVVNNADQIVTFKNGYFLTAATSYVAKNPDITDQVRQYNDYVRASGNAVADNLIVDWFHTVGLGVKFVEPNKEDDERRPFFTYALDPRSAFVAYSLKPGNRPVVGVNIAVMDETVYFDVITRDRVFKVKGSMVGMTTIKTPIVGTGVSVEDDKPNLIGEIPIIEYQYDHNRMSAFESGIPICDEINTLESNRADGVEQSIQQLFVAVNCNFDDGVTANEIRESGMLNLKSTGENRAYVELLETSLSQSETQVSLDSLYDQLLDKVGLPSIGRNEGGTSDNGSAVYLRSGYSIADTMRRNTEDFFRRSDEQYKQVVLAILKRKQFEIAPDELELVIEPPTMSNLLVKTQSALNMRELGLAPQIWLERSGLSNDPQNDLELSKDYIYRFYDEKEKEVESEGQELYDERQVEELSAFELD